MRSAIVTGGAGFIGSHLVERLLEEGWFVTVVDNFDPFYPREVKWKNLEKARSHPNFRLLEVDIRDLEALRRILDGHYDVIVHLAAKAGVRPSLHDPVGYYEVNVRGTQNLLEIAKEKGITRFVFASSSSVYGMNPNLPWREDDPLLRPVSPYGASKVAGEILGHVYSHLYGIRFIALRIFTVYGPRQRPDLAIHKFARLLRENKPIPIYGDGSSLRDYTYISDVVEGICKAIDYDGNPYEVINLGSGHPVRLLELVQMLEGILGGRAELKFLPPQPGDIPQTWADVSKAQRLLGWWPKTDLSNGLTQFVAWVTSHQSFQPSVDKTTANNKKS